MVAVLVLGKEDAIAAVTTTEPVRVEAKNL
jgi:hypothetical protein